VRVLRVALSVMNVDGPPFESGARRATLSSGRDGMFLQECHRFRGGVVSSRDTQHLPVEAEDAGLLCPAQPDAILGQALDDGLEVESRPADDLEQLTGCCLLLERFRQVLVASSQLLEQPHILDCNDSLVRKSLKQRDLLFSERLDLGSANRDGANRYALA